MRPWKSHQTHRTLYTLHNLFKKNKKHEPPTCNQRKKKIYKNPIIILLIIGSTLLCLSSNTWILLWTILEINTLAFSRWTTKKPKTSSESTIKYTIIQISSSAIILITAIYSENINKLTNYRNTIFLITRCIKIGASPLHSWFMTIRKTSEWNQFMILATIQKIPPILILSMTKIKSTELIIISTTTIPTISQINRKTTKEILTSSSVFNRSWLISRTILRTKTIIIITLTYMTRMIPIINISSKTQKINNQENSPSKWEKLLISINIAGIPPTINFIGKLWVVKRIRTKRINPLAATIITTRTVNLIIYLQASSRSISRSKKSKKNKIKEKEKISIATTIPIIIIITSGQEKVLIGPKQTKQVKKSKT